MAENWDISGLQTTKKSISRRKLRQARSLQTTLSKKISMARFQLEK